MYGDSAEIKAKTSHAICVPVLAWLNIALKKPFEILNTLVLIQTIIHIICVLSGYCLIGCWVLALE